MRRLLIPLGLTALAFAFMSAPAWAVSGAGYTTVDVAADGNNHCKNGNPPVNCNIYDGKEFVWLNGGPAANGLGPDGRYFFAVLVPGGQPNPNDGGAKNLSDDFDAFTNRTFTVSGGEVSAYAGTHSFDSGTGGGAHPNGQPPFIRLFPYADTTNPGGVYIMAICSLAAGYPVDPRDCKYDAFKVQKGAGKVQAVLSGAKYLDANKNGMRDAGEVGIANWSIHITGSDGTDVHVTTDASGDWTYTTGAHNATSGVTKYVLDEEQQAGYSQSGNTVDQTLAAGGATVSLASFDYTVTVPNDAVSAVSDLFFGNFLNSPPVCSPLVFSPDGSSFSLTAQDADSGIAALKVTSLTNGILTDPFTFGTTDPVTLTVTRINPALNYGLEVDVVDIYGATTHCDPIAARLVTSVTGGAARTFRGLARAESTVTISNGAPGVRSVTFSVNGKRFVVRGLRPGQTRVVSVASAMRPGSSNVIRVIARGRPGATAAIAVSD